MGSLEVGEQSYDFIVVGGMHALSSKTGITQSDCVSRWDRRQRCGWTTRGEPECISASHRSRSRVQSSLPPLDMIRLTRLQKARHEANQ